jgi:hypothetical protein
MTEKPNQPPHLTFEQLLDYLERRLPTAEVSQVEAHLASDCQSCRADLSWLEETVNLMVSDAWVDPPAALGTAARQIFRQERQSKAATVSALHWLRSLWKPRRRLAVGMAFALTLIVLGAVVAQLWFGQMASQEAQPVAISGIVEVQPAESDSWEPVTEELSVNAGDQIRTGSDSSVVLKFPDDSMTKMEPNTVVGVVRMTSRPDGSRQVTMLRQEFGQTRNIVQPLPSPDSRFQIETPAATVTVRGTEFVVDVDLDGETEVAVVAGIVDVLAQGTTVSLLEGQRTIVFPGEEPAVVADIPTPGPVGVPRGIDPIDKPLSGETTTAEPTLEDEEETPLPTETGAAPNSTPTPSTTPSPRPSTTPFATSSATPSATPSATALPTVVLPPTQPPPVEPAPTDPPPTSEPPATIVPVETRRTPPGHTRTPQPPGQTRTPAGKGK